VDAGRGVLNAQSPVVDPQAQKKDFRDDYPCLHASILNATAVRIGAGCPISLAVLRDLKYAVLQANSRLAGGIRISMVRMDISRACPATRFDARQDTALLSTGSVDDESRENFFAGAHFLEAPPVLVYLPLP
jgi:hypothetical protein